MNPNGRPLCPPRVVDPAGLSVGADLYPVVRTSILRAPVPQRDLGVPIVEARPLPAPPPARRGGLRVRLSFA
ncbi:MAG: hypothetical protein ACK4YP_05185 [Myxococcota bacterium]